MRLCVKAPNITRRKEEGDQLREAVKEQYFDKVKKGVAYYSLIRQKNI